MGLFASLYFLAAAECLPGWILPRQPVFSSNDACVLLVTLYFDSVTRGLEQWDGQGDWSAQTSRLWTQSGGSLPWIRSCSHSTGDMTARTGHSQHGPVSGISSPALGESGVSLHKQLTTQENHTKVQIMKYLMLMYVRLRDSNHRSKPLLWVASPLWSHVLSSSWLLQYLYAGLLVVMANAILQCFYFH